MHSEINNIRSHNSHMRLCVNHINELEMPHLVTNTQQNQSTSILLVALPMSMYRNKVLWKKGNKCPNS